MAGVPNDGFNMFMRSRGEMNIALQAYGMAHGPEKVFISWRIRLPQYLFSL